MAQHSQEGTRVIHRNLSLRRVGFISFSIAIFLGVLLILARAMPDLESTMYGFIKYGYPRLTSLSCPVLMTLQDREPVTVRLRNPLDKNLSYYVNAQFSSGVMISTIDQRVELQPGETKTLSWEVGKENIDLGNFIFARVFTSAASSLGMRESTCGTFVVKLPVRGGPVIFYAISFLAVLGAAVGLLLWFRHSEMSQPDVISQSLWMRFIAMVVAVGIMAGILNLWFFAILTVLLALLTTSVFLIPRKI
jgi:hypothetical protein